MRAVERREAGVNVVALGNSTFQDRNRPAATK
jgi:hypothetical protein